MLFLRDMIRRKTVCIRVYSSIRGVQSCLHFGAAQQSRSCQWVISTRQLSFADKNAEHLPLTRMSLIRPFTTVLHSAYASPFQLNMYPLCPMFTAVRHRRRKMNRKSDHPLGQSAEDEVIRLTLLNFLTVAGLGKTTLLVPLIFMELLIFFSDVGDGTAPLFQRSAILMVPNFTQKVSVSRV